MIRGMLKWAESWFFWPKNGLLYSKDDGGVADGFPGGCTHFAEHYFVAVGMGEQDTFCFAEGFGGGYCRRGCTAPQAL